MKTFHWTALAGTGILVTLLTGTAVLMPTPGGTSVAHARFPQQEAGSSSVPGTAVADFATASGQAGVNLVQAALNYDLNAVLQGSSEVPRIALESFPDALMHMRVVDQRKAMFFKTVLPLVLQVNEQILKDRTRLQDLAVQQKAKTPLRAVDRLWLAAMADRYGVRRGHIAALLKRHDVVPPSLALAQAASESGWGTSRFVREGNAMFGEWTFANTHPGLVPAERAPGKTHRIRVFSSLYDSVMSYAINLNKHRAYQEFRDMRATMRATGQALDGMHLAGALYRYSERGMDYVAELQVIISSNDLAMLDGARLSQAGNLEPAI